MAKKGGKKGAKKDKTEVEFGNPADAEADGEKEKGEKKKAKEAKAEAKQAEAKEEEKPAKKQDEATFGTEGATKAEDPPKHTHHGKHGHHGHKKQHKKADDMTAEEAATKIQAAVRGKTGKLSAKAKAKKKAARRAKEEKAKRKAAARLHEAQIADPSLLFDEGEVRDHSAYVRKEGRGCTDCLFCLIFMAYWAGALFLSWFAFENGELNRLIMPRDTDLNSCGMLNKEGKPGEIDLTDFPALYLPNPAMPEEYQICVNKCPSSSTTGKCTGNTTRDYSEGKLSCGLFGHGGGSHNSVATTNCPDQYTSKTTCEKKGDCSDGAINRDKVGCATKGLCSDGRQDIKQHLCEFNQTRGPAYLSNTGLAWRPNMWTSYTYTYDDSGLAMMMCTPPGSSGAPNDPDYVFDQGEPKFKFQVAVAKGWVSMAGPCWMPVLESQDVVFRCVPLMLADFSSPAAMEGSMAGGAAAQYFQDIATYWFVIPMGGTFAICAAFAWIIFLSKFAGTLIWFTVYALETLLPILSLVCFYQAGMIKSPVPVPPEVLAEMENLDQSASTEYLQIIAYASGGAWIVLGCIFSIFKTRIEISIGVIEEASDSFLDMPLCVFFPIVQLIVSIPVTVYCLCACFLLLSLRGVDTKTGLATYPLIDLEYGGVAVPWPIDLRALLGYQVFGWLWNCWFLSCVQFTSVAGAVATWYFTLEDDKGQKNLSHFLLSQSLIRTLAHHMGTMAFGSCIIAVVMTGKFVAVYAITQIQAQSPDNKVIQILGNCLKCVVSCVDRFVRFLGHLAFIETAIYGTSFCRSLVKAFARLVKNIIRFSFVTVFAKLVLLLGKILVIIASVWWSILAMQIWKKQEPNSAVGDGSIPVAPLVLTGILGGIISFSVMGVYETAIDTIMMCFLEDETENDQKSGISFASGPLRQFMSGTRAIADAEIAYGDSVREAKTSRIRSGAEAEAQILGDTKAVGDRTGVRAHRDAIKPTRGKSKRGEKRHHKKKSKKGNNKAGDASTSDVV